jgi:hypothetical protein
VISLEYDDGRPLAPVRDGLVLDEYRTYVVRGADAAEWNGVALSARNDTFVLETGSAAGRHRLTARREDTAITASLEVRPSPLKLSADEWLQMLNELEAWIAAASSGLGGGRASGIAGGGAAPGWLVEALLPLVPALVAAVRALSDNLRSRKTTPLEYHTLWSSRAAATETVSWLGRHPLAASWVVQGVGEAFAGPPPRILTRGLGRDLDHPVNRAVRWILGRVARAIDASAEVLMAAGPDFRDWCDVRAGALRAASGLLRQTVAQSALNVINPQAPTEAAMAVLLGEPHYARVVGLARPFLALSITTDETEAAVPMRPTYGLYEVWCLATVSKALEAVYPSMVWSVQGVSQLLRPGHTGSGFVTTGSSGEEHIELRFNARFRSFHASPHGRFSITAERRPDLVIGHRGAGKAPAWLFLDAKYRVGSNLLEAFDSAHIYRDSLRWDEFGGQPACGALLSPAESPETTVYFREDYRARYGLGAFALRPGHSTQALTDWIAGQLHASANPAT